MINNSLKYNMDIEVKKDYICISLNPSGLISRHLGGVNDYDEYAKYFIPFIDFGNYSGSLTFHIDEIYLSILKDNKTIYSEMMRYYKHAKIENKPKYPLACKIPKENEAFIMFNKLLMAEELIK